MAIVTLEYLSAIKIQIMTEPKIPNPNQEENQNESPIRRKRPRPDIEGITIPFSSRPTIMTRPNLTPSEKKLIEETETKRSLEETVRPMMGKITLPKRRPSYAKWFLTLLFLVILGITGYELYLRYFPGQQPTAEQTDPYADLAFQGEPFIPTEEITTPGLKPATTTPTSTPAEADETTTTPATPPPAMLKVTATPTDFLNVRQSASLSSPIITKIHPGEAYPYTDYQNGWYKITLTDGTVGWVSEQYVKKLP